MRSIYNVLFIDDNEINNELTKAIVDVEDLPINATTHTNPVEALKYLGIINNQDFPTYIFVDVNMPELDGFTFVERYEKEFPENNTQIYFLSASIVEEDKSRAMQYKSVIGYYEKPFSIEIANDIFNFGADEDE